MLPANNAVPQLIQCHAAQPQTVQQDLANSEVLVGGVQGLVDSDPGGGAPLW